MMVPILPCWRHNSRREVWAFRWRRSVWRCLPWRRRLRVAMREEQKVGWLMWAKAAVRQKEGPEPVRSSKVVRGGRVIPFEAVNGGLPAPNDGGDVAVHVVLCLPRAVASVSAKVPLDGDYGGEVGLNGDCNRGPPVEPSFASGEVGPGLGLFSCPGRGEA